MASSVSNSTIIARTSYHTHQNAPAQRNSTPPDMMSEKVKEFQVGAHNCCPIVDQILSLFGLNWTNPPSISLTQREVTTVIYQNPNNNGQ